MSASSSAARALAPAPTPSAVHAPPVRDAAEREAERAGQSVAGGALLTGWSFASVPVSPPQDAERADDPRVVAAVGGPGRELDAPARGPLEARFGLDLSSVRLHDDAESAEATRSAGANAVTVGDDIALAEPLSPELLGHEIAHVAQQRTAGASAAQFDGTPAPPATTLGALPEADRKRIQAVTTTQVTVPDLADKFATTGTTVTLALPGGVAVEFDASVDAAQQHGLRNVAGSLSAGVELTPAPLPPNSTVTLELDVPGAGKGLYRFTYHAPPPPGGKKKATPHRIVVEALGKATPPAGTKAPAPPTQGGQAAPDPVADKITKHSLTQSYSGAELDALRAAIDQIPDAHLAVVSGLTFARDTADANDPTAGGHYDQTTHTITMFDNVFSGSQTRSMKGGTASDEPTRAIVHEIGHAVDLAPLRKANLTREAADAAAALLPTRFPDPADPTGFRWTNPTEKAQIEAVLKAQKDAETAQLGARSRSGTKTVKDASGTFVDEIGTDPKGSKFREAWVKDGKKAVSAYGDTDFQEGYAEAYSLFIASPDTLKALRPKTFDYFDKNLPK